MKVSGLDHVAALQTSGIWIPFKKAAEVVMECVEWLQPFWEGGHLAQQCLIVKTTLAEFNNED